MQKTLCFSRRWDVDELKILSVNILTRGIMRRSCLLVFPVPLSSCPVWNCGVKTPQNKSIINRLMAECLYLFRVWSFMVIIFDYGRLFSVSVWLKSSCSAWKCFIYYIDFLFILIPQRAIFVYYYFSKNVWNSVCVDHLIVCLFSLLLLLLEEQ